MINPRFSISFFLIVLFSISGCDSEYSHTQVQNFPESVWKMDSIITFKFKIDRPVSPLNLLYQVQFRPDYPFENIWLDYSLKGPNGNELTASRDNLNLFESKTGKPIGDGVGNRIFLDAYFLKGIRLKDTGIYILEVKHYMRQENLIGIQSLGLKIRSSE